MNRGMAPQSMEPAGGCAHEQDVLDLVLHGRWPDRVDAETHAHVADCMMCREVVDIAMAMQQADTSDAAPAALPDATLVYWRAQLRAHEEAGRRAARPIALAQGIGIGFALVAFVAVIRTFWPWIRAYGASAGGALSTTAASAAASAATVPLWLAIGLAATLVAAPVAVYFALGKD
jgi:hypothetical protein